MAGRVTGPPTSTRLSSNSSRFGLRGTEALGGGLNAIWQIESSVSGDAGGGTIAGRDTFLGLQGSWGTVRFGNFLAPYDDVHPVFGDSGTYLTSIAAQAAIWANNGGYTKGTGSFDDRLGNSLRYDSPNIAGFTGSVQVALFDDAGPGGSTSATVWSTAGQYKNGPFTGILAFEYNNDVRCYNGNAGGTNATCAGGTYTRWPPTTGRSRPAAAWDFGIVRVAGLYERIDYDTPQGGLKRDLFGGYFSGPVGPGKWYVGYSYAKDGKGPTTQRVNGIYRRRRLGCLPPVAVLQPADQQAHVVVRRVLVPRERGRRKLQLQHQPVPQRDRRLDGRGNLESARPRAQRLPGRHDPPVLIASIRGAGPPVPQSDATGALGRPFFLRSRARAHRRAPHACARCREHGGFD